jgi:hypothetical protein
VLAVAFSGVKTVLETVLKEGGSDPWPVARSRSIQDRNKSPGEVAPKENGACAKSTSTSKAERSEMGVWAEFCLAYDTEPFTMKLSWMEAPSMLTK